MWTQLQKRQGVVLMQTLDILLFFCSLQQLCVVFLHVYSEAFFFIHKREYMFWNHWSQSSVFTTCRNIFRLTTFLLLDSKKDLKWLHEMLAY